MYMLCQEARGRIEAKRLKESIFRISIKSTRGPVPGSVFVEVKIYSSENILDGRFERIPPDRDTVRLDIDPRVFE